MTSYADTGFIVSLYFVESTTAAAVKIMGELLPITLLHEAEFRNTLNLKLWRKQITVAERDTAVRQFEADIADNFFQREDLSKQELQRTIAQLSDRHTATMGVRTLDLLHVAAALLLNASKLLTFDERQRRMAEAAGLTVRP